MVSIDTDMAERFVNCFSNSVENLNFLQQNSQLSLNLWKNLFDGNMVA